VEDFRLGEFEDKSHPCMKGVPESFVISREEWYTWDRSPRGNIRVLARVDEATYSPDSAVKMGGQPVIWSNEHVAARNIYIFMGHGPDLLENKAFSTFWARAQCHRVPAFGLEHAEITHLIEERAPFSGEERDR